MKLSNIAVAAAMVLSSTVAMAATGPLDLSSGSTFFGNTPMTSGFADTYTFSLLSAAVVTSSITAAVAGLQDVDFSAIYLTGPSGVYSFTQVLADPFETWTLTSPSLVAGAYTLTLIGTNSPTMGSYSGNIGVTAAVPEPQTYALLLAGLLTVGLVSRRRSN